MRNALKVLVTKKMLICVFTGFSSGLPLYLLLNLVPAWLRSEGIDLKTIGLFALIQFPYTWKFLWAPLLDRFPLFGLGRRRGWILLTQLGLLLTVAALGRLAPHEDIRLILLVCALIACFSATQDIALDAYRRELLVESELGLGNAIHVNAYRVAGLIPGSLSLILSDFLPWSQVFLITSAFIFPGLLMVLFIREPDVVKSAPRSLLEAVSEPLNEFISHKGVRKALSILAFIFFYQLGEPLNEFISRKGVREALSILAFIFFYKLGDSLCTALATPFYQDMGFSKTDIGIIAKHAGLWPAVIGGLLGGLWMLRLGINRALWLFGVVQLVSIFGFAWLAWIGSHAVITLTERLELALVIGVEALGVGLGTAAFVAFIAKSTHPSYTATQFALFTSLAAVPRTFINASAGWFVENMGWMWFFLMCSVLAIPGMLLLLLVAPWNAADDASFTPIK